MFKKIVQVAGCFSLICAVPVCGSVTEEHGKFSLKWRKLDGTVFENFKYFCLLKMSGSTEDLLASFHAF